MQTKETRRARFAIDAALAHDDAPRCMRDDAHAVAGVCIYIVARREMKVDEGERKVAEDPCQKYYNTVFMY